MPYPNNAPGSQILLKVARLISQGRAGPVIVRNIRTLTVLKVTKIVTKNCSTNLRMIDCTQGSTEQDHAPQPSEEVPTFHMTEGELHMYTEDLHPQFAEDGHCLITVEEGLSLGITEDHHHHHHRLQ